MAHLLPRISTRASLQALGALALIASLIIPTPVSAGGPGLEVLQVGWDGHVVPGAWAPVRVRLTGGGADLTGRVEVVSKARYQTGQQATSIEYAVGAYGQVVALPAGIVKEVTLWLPSNVDLGGNVASSGSVRLVANGRTVTEERVEFRGAKTALWPLIGVLADSTAIARALAQVELPLQGLPVPLSVARLMAADLPASVELLGSLSALVVQGSGATTLTGEQRDGIRQWVAAGGHLLLLGGPDAPRAVSVLPANALPVTFSGADGSADLSALALWGEAKAQPLAAGPAIRFRAEQGALLAGSANRPLAWRFGLGQGSVTLLAADPALEPLIGWTGTPALLRKALEPALRSAGDADSRFQYVQVQQRDPSNRLRGAVDTLPPEALPGWRDVALLLGGFLVVVGPGLHLVLRRADRRMWSWALVPALAVLLAAGMYYVGVGRDGRDVLVNVVSHLRLDSSGDPARQSLMAGFYGPTHSTLTVEVPGEAPVRPSTSSMPYSPYGNPGASPSIEPPFRVITGRDTTVEFDSGQWGMRTVTLSRSLDAGRIAANLQLEGGLIKGTIRNETPYLLEDAAVLVGQSAARLGSLAPGQTAPVALDPGPAANPFAGRYPVSWRLFGKPWGGGRSGSSASVAIAVPAQPIPATSYVAVQPMGIPEQVEVPQDPEVQRRIRLIDSIVNVPRPGPSQSVPLTFLAFTRAPVGDQLPSARGHPVFYLTLLEEPLRLELPPGPFTLPPALTTAEVVSQNGYLGGGGNGTYTWVQLQGGSMVYELRPPLPAKASVDTLIISTRQIGQSTAAGPGKGMPAPYPDTLPGPAESGLFAVYNWQSAGWEALPGGLEETRLRPAAPYIGSDGSVKLQASAADRMVSFLPPELTVQGTVAP